jgi:hypothetical protein
MGDFPLYIPGIFVSQGILKMKKEEEILWQSIEEKGAFGAMRLRVVG